MVKSVIPNFGSLILQPFRSVPWPTDGAVMTDSAHESLTLDAWEPLSADVAEWMGLDEAMVPLVLGLDG